MKKIMFSLVLVLVMSGCASQSTYDEKAAQSDSPTMLAEANEFLQTYATCAVDEQCAAQCNYAGQAGVASMMKEGHINRLDTDDQRVRWYRKVRHACYFITVSNVR